MSARAERLRADLVVDTLTGIPRALAEELVLTLERMEQLDKTLQGDADVWLGIRMKLGSFDVAELTITAPLAEVRQQGAAFRGLVAEFVKVTGAEVATPVTGAADDLKKRREERRANLA